MVTHEQQALAYYTAMAEKDFEGMEKCVHPDVQFSSSLTSLKGKESVMEGAKSVILAFKTLTIRAVCSSKNEVMLAYDLDWGLPIGVLRVAALMTFKDNLIHTIELFFDTRAFS